MRAGNSQRSPASRLLHGRRRVRQNDENGTPISPTQLDLHILAADPLGRMNRQEASGYHNRSKVEAAIRRYGGLSATH